jgi:hypothetical protein
VLQLKVNTLVPAGTQRFTGLSLAPHFTASFMFLLTMIRTLPLLLLLLEFSGAASLSQTRVVTFG